MEQLGASQKGEVQRGERGQGQRAVRGHDASDEAVAAHHELPLPRIPAHGVDLHRPTLPASPLNESVAVAMQWSHSNPSAAAGRVVAQQGPQPTQVASPNAVVNAVDGNGAAAPTLARAVDLPVPQDWSEGRESVVKDQPQQQYTAAR